MKLTYKGTKEKWNKPFKWRYQDPTFLPIALSQRLIRWDSTNHSSTIFVIEQVLPPQHRCKCTPFLLLCINWISWYKLKQVSSWCLSYLTALGSGKTGAYLLPVIQLLLTHLPTKPKSYARQYPFFLCLVPTRELAVQIFEEAKKAIVTFSVVLIRT